MKKAISEFLERAAAEQERKFLLDRWSRDQQTGESISHESFSVSLKYEVQTKKFHVQQTKINMGAWGRLVIFLYVENYSNLKKPKRCKNYY